jgi:hypothetical protein
VDPHHNPAWPPPPGAINVQPYGASKDYRTFMAFFAALDESDSYSPSVVVEGRQYVVGREERWCSVYGLNAGTQLTAAGSRRLAAFLLDAADGLDKHK